MTTNNKADTTDLQALIAGRIRLVEAECDREPWKLDHAQAMVCLSIEESVRVLVETFDAMVRVDEFIRDGVVAGRLKRVDYPKFAAAFDRLLKSWLSVSARLEPVVTRFENANYAIELAGRFRECIAEVRWGLASPKSLFSDDAFVAARDRAVDDLRGGRCLPDPE